VSASRGILVLSAAITFAPVATLSAEGAPPAPPTEAKFESLVSEIGVLRSDLDRLDRRERGIVSDMDRLQVESALCSRELERLSLLRLRTRAELGESRTKLAAARGEIQGGEAALARNLREVYETGQLKEVRMILSLTEPVDVMRAVAYLDVVARRQSDAMEILRRRRAEAERLEASLDDQARTLEDLARQSGERARELQDNKRRSAQLLDSIRKEVGVNRRAIAELTRAASELEAAIVSGYTGGDVTRQPADPAPPDVGELRGALEWPVPGVVKVPFGDLRHPRFGTVTPHPGIDIETGPGTPIRAVMGGRVIFSRRFSGYGNTVLVDHGKRYLSVYARAAVLNVVEGEEVLPGQVLGVSAEQAFDNGRPTVYFEFRHEGRAVDPSSWLKRRPTAGREDMR
jgi:septal ring factor EnvC (AmiA/AmiB activator)